MQPLIHIVYASKAKQAFEPEAMSELMRRSRSANESHGLTGFLLYDNSNFFQLLEGPQGAVTDLFQKIRADSRHGEIVCFVHEPLQARAFEEWSMTCMTISRGELSAINGLKDFFAAGATFMQLNAPQARLLVAAFVDGRWRENIAGRASKGKSLDLMPDPDAPSAHAATLPLAHWVAPYGRSYAYQPIVDTFSREVVSYEALIRGARGESAFQVLSAVPPEELYRFDAEGRVAAIEMAARLGLPCDLNLNFMPQSAVTSPRILESTLAVARHCGIALDRIVIEITESEAIQDHRQFAELIAVYRRQGLKVAIDDFGAGYSGLNLLAEFQPDQIKVDIALVRQIQMSGPRQSIVRSLVGLCRELRIDVIAEGIESLDELRWLENQGVCLFQGYLFAKPGFECLPSPSFPPLSLQPRNMLRAQEPELESAGIGRPQTVADAP